MTFSPKQTQNPLKKDSNLRLFKKDAKVGGCHSITSRIFIKYFHEDFYMYNILLKIITYHQKNKSLSLDDWFDNGINLCFIKKNFMFVKEI